MSVQFLGLDIGGSKSHALIAESTGRILSCVEAGSGNPDIIGYDGLRDVLETITREALAQAGISRDGLRAVGAGIAGYNWPSQLDQLLRITQTLAIDAPFQIVNDALIGLLAGARQGWGIVLVAGTGCNCRGWDRDRREGRVVGVRSARLGEAASTAQFLDRALQAVAFEWTRRGAPTRLTDVFIHAIGARDGEDLLEGLTLGRYSLPASAVGLVFEAAEQGDRAAADVVRWAGTELGDLARGVVHQLGFEQLEFEVVLVGGLYNGGPLLVDAVRQKIHEFAPMARLVRLTAPPVIGGVLLAMEHAGIEPSKLRELLIKESQDFERYRIKHP
jgi:N-acetylglucosamine kinase-like BadF-type ATPase